MPTVSVFLFAAVLWSAIALAVWIGMFTTGAVLPSRFDPLAWHIHEMLFGFVMAAVAGFLLTAIPNWTGRSPVGGGLLALLIGLWLLGRVACMVSALLPPWWAAVADLSFPLVLAGMVSCEVVAAQNWRNLPMLAPVVVLGVASLCMHLQAGGVSVPEGLGWRLGVAGVIVLVSAMGGRIVPSFTRNWLTRRPGAAVPPPGLIDWLALGALHGGLMAWTFLPEAAPVGGLLLLGGALNLWRLLRWRGGATVGEPLLLILHVGYAWLVLGATLLGLATLGADVPLSAAIHALTVGAVGTMILAVMTRATRGHTGRALTADRVASALYLLVALAAITRIAATFGAGWTMSLLEVSACLWVAAFAGFAISYGPMLLLPPRRQ
ncbi:MAG: NnrS family protein [Acetobacteraceae bacterium SCN 69-10]|nr:NnrS family protein [Rhodospirillales bacterium]ODU62517.1 MAG: NnrS family protein [Acetobacteraceae bacterium SCN 69-10]OJY76119.1 MAG: NnrS family protein [Rhodospirillales bacterium 70-18]